MSNLGAYQTTVEDMKKSGGPEAWIALVRQDSWQDGYSDGSHAMLAKLAIPSVVGLLYIGKQIIDHGRVFYAETKEKRLLIKKNASEAEEKLTQLYNEELNEKDREMEVTDNV